MKIERDLSSFLREPHRPAELLSRFQRIRGETEALAARLSPEDCMLQSMADASPVKWHLAHTAWFFETFVLEPAVPGFRPHQLRFRMLFNSYYVGVGERHARAERGMLSRPSLQEVIGYRHAVDDQIVALLSGSALGSQLLDIVELGLNHEQQHQELILTDLKHHFWRNPLLPAYLPPYLLAERRERVDGNSESATREATEYDYLRCEGGLVEIGHAGSAFAFDNETPRHRVWLDRFDFGRRLVTNGEYLQFIADGGYRRPELWLSDGWDKRAAEDWHTPLYWMSGDENGSANASYDRVFTLSGVQSIGPNEPVCHVSYYEAEAYARWAGARLATEFEWEAMASRKGVSEVDGGFLESNRLHPRPESTYEMHGASRETPARQSRDSSATQMAGEVWQWTQSAYLPYPRYKPLAGAVGEYNGKFMINQMVLRGGSCATPRDHVRASYRNFFPPHARWQFSGIRLARDCT